MERRQHTSNVGWDVPTASVPSHEPILTQFKTWNNISQVHIISLGEKSHHWFVLSQFLKRQRPHLIYVKKMGKWGSFTSQKLRGITLPSCMPSARQFPRSSLEIQSQPAPLPIYNSYVCIYAAVSLRNKGMKWIYFASSSYMPWCLHRLTKK